jgi:hypothetical protein
MNEYKGDVFSSVVSYPPSKETVDAMRKQSGDVFNCSPSSDVNEFIVGSINQKLLEVDRLLNN